MSEPKKCCEKSDFVFVDGWYYLEGIGLPMGKHVRFCLHCGAELTKDGPVPPRKPLPFSLSEEDCQKHALKLAWDMGLRAFAGGGSCAACLCAEVGHVHFPTWAETRAALLGVKYEKTRLAQIIHGAIPECEGMGEKAEEKSKTDAYNLAKELGLTVVLNEDPELNWIAEVPVAGLPEHFLSVAGWDELTLLLRGMRTERWRAERKEMGEKAEAKSRDESEKIAEDLGVRIFQVPDPLKTGRTVRVFSEGQFGEDFADFAAAANFLRGLKAERTCADAIPSEDTNNEREAFDLGVFRPVVARPDGTLLAGHGVVEAAKQAGQTTIPVYIFDVLYGRPLKAEIPEGEVLATENVSGWVHPDRLASGHARLIDELSKGMGPLTANGTGEGLVAITATTTVRRREVPAKLRRWRVTWLKATPSGGMIGRIVEVEAGSEVDAREIAAMAFRRENGDGPDCYTVKVEALDN
jgi:hypothetical protein